MKDERKAKNILVTGATGQIGSELTIALREKYGNKNVVALGHSRKPCEDLACSGPYEVADAREKKALLSLIKKHKIDTVYHLVGILSANAEKNPDLAWDVNMGSLKNVLDLAKELKLFRVFWPSSIAAFGPSTPRVKTPQQTVLEPNTMYGVTKVAGELMCNYYFLKYGVDVRSLRYPGLISYKVPPTGGTTDYASDIHFEAVRHKKYECFLRSDTVLPMMYMPDAIKATMQLMEVSPNRVKIRTSYNVTAFSFSPIQLIELIKKRMPEFKCTCKPDFHQAIADSWPRSIDDSRARKDWGWKPEYTLAKTSTDMLDNV